MPCISDPAKAARRWAASPRACRADGRAAAPRLDPYAAATFRGFSYYLICAWHLHPLAWFLGVTHVASPYIEHLMWFAADMMTKTAPLLLLACFASGTMGSSPVASRREPPSQEAKSAPLWGNGSSKSR